MIEKEKKKRGSVEGRFLMYAIIALFLLLAIGTAMLQNAYSKNIDAVPPAAKQLLVLFSLIVSAALSFLIIQKQKKDDANQQQENGKQECTKCEKTESTTQAHINAPNTEYNAIDRTIDYFQKKPWMLVLTIMIIIVLIDIFII